MPGENGVKPHCKVIDISDDYEEAEESDDGKPQWKGIEDVLIAYREYIKGLFAHLLRFFRLFSKYEKKKKHCSDTSR